MHGSCERRGAQRKSTGGQTVIRRLNRLELRSTLRDLLHQRARGPEGAVGVLLRAQPRHLRRGLGQQRSQQPPKKVEV